MSETTTETKTEEPKAEPEKSIIYHIIGFKKSFEDEPIFYDYMLVDEKNNLKQLSIPIDLGAKLFEPCNIEADAKTGIVTKILPLPSEKTKEEKICEYFDIMKNPPLEGIVKGINKEHGILTVSTSKGEVAVFGHNLVEEMGIKTGYHIKAFGDSGVKNDKLQFYANILIGKKEFNEKSEEFAKKKAAAEKEASEKKKAEEAKKIDDLALDDATKNKLKKFITENVNDDVPYEKIEANIISEFNKTTNPDIDAILETVSFDIKRVKDHKERMKPVIYPLTEKINILDTQKNGKHIISLDDTTPSNILAEFKQNWTTSPKKFAELEKLIKKLRPELKEINLSENIREFATKVQQKWPVLDQKEEEKEEIIESIIIAHRKIILEERKLDIITVPIGIKFEARPMFIYNEKTGCWTNTARDIIQTYCSTIPELDTKADQNNLINNIQGQTSNIVDAKMFHPKENYSNFTNGYYDILNDNFTEKHGKACKDLFFRTCNDFPYEKGVIDMPEFQRILDIGWDVKYHKLILQIFGLVLSSVRVKKNFWPVGKTNSLKSTLFMILAHMVGLQNVTNHSPEMLSGTKAPVYLHEEEGKALNIIFDLKKGYINDCGTIKEKCGGTDGVTVERKFEDPRSSIPTSKDIFIGNHFQRLSQLVMEDEAFWSRAVAFRGKNKIVYPEGFEMIEDFPTLLETVYRKEFPAIYNNAMIELRDYIKTKKLDYHDDPYTVWFESEEDDKPCEDFINTYFTMIDSDDIKYSTPTELVQEMHKIYCNEMKEKMMSDTTLGMHIRNLGIEKKKSRLFHVIDEQIPAYKRIIPKKEKFGLVNVSNPDMYHKYLLYYVNIFNEVPQTEIQYKPINMAL